MNDRSSKLFTILPQETDARQTLKLIFNRSEDQYFLAEMISPTLAAKFMRSKAETKLARSQTLVQETIAVST